MKTALKVVGAVLLIAGALIIGALTWLSFKKPAAHPPSTEKIEATPARLARGQYLVEHVADCIGCHSAHLETYGFPVKPGTKGQGGDFVFDEKLGFPGVVAAQNITPDPETGLGKWTDGEIMRAIREGVDRNGKALFPMMPYQHLRSMSDEDAKSVVVYLRSLPAIHNGVPAGHLDFPLKYIVKFIPQPLDGPVPQPDPKDTLAHGKYLSIIGGCLECHTPHDDKNRLIPEQAYSGGWKMDGPWGTVVTANLTSASHTYMGKARREEFVGRFQSLAVLNAENSPVPLPGRNTVMPWLAFSHMTAEDLGAIYDYLKTIPANPRVVNSFPNAKK
jgi:mono/diheme cytochrome c family protein